MNEYVEYLQLWPVKFNNILCKPTSSNSYIKVIRAFVPLHSISNTNVICYLVSQIWHLHTVQPVCLPPSLALSAVLGSVDVPCKPDVSLEISNLTRQSSTGSSLEAVSSTVWPTRGFR